MPDAGLFLTQLQDVTPSAMLTNTTSFADSTIDMLHTVDVNITTSREGGPVN